MTLDMGAVGRSITDGFGFLKVLQASEDFGDVVPFSVGDVSGAGGGGEIHYTMRYTPVAPVPGKPAPKGAASPVRPTSRRRRTSRERAPGAPAVLAAAGGAGRWCCSR